MNLRSTPSVALTALLALLLGCTGEDDAPPPPPTGPSATQPTTAQPTDTETIPRPESAALPPGLTGLYELAWLQNGPSAPRQTMPGMLIASLPGCVWARWGWQFGADGALTLSNEMLCRVPPGLGQGHGVCRAEVQTAVRWREGGFALPAPVSSESRFVQYTRIGESGSFDTATVRCSVSMDAVEATLTEIVPGAAPDRPAALVLSLSDGGLMHLRAVDGPPVNHADLILAN
jgi:hypothetical protein